MNIKIILFAILLLTSTSGTFTYYKSLQPVSGESIAQGITARLQDYIQSVDGEANNILSELRKGRSAPNSKTQFIVLKGDKIISWSNHRFIPSPAALQGNFEVKFLKSGEEDLLVKRWVVDTSSVLVAIVPLHVQYKISNDYLRPDWNKDIFSTNEVILLESSAASGYPVLKGNENIFRILPVQGLNQTTGLWGALTIILFSTALIVSLIFLFKVIRKLSKGSPTVGFFALLILLTTVRMAMIKLGFPAGLTDSPLFDPKNFASSEFNPSLGDLILSSICVLVLCIYLFRNYFRFSILKYCFSNRVISFIVSIICVLLILFGMLFPFVVIQTIYNNSAISLSISDSLRFDQLRILTFLSIVITWISSFLFMHVFIKILLHEKRIIFSITSIIIGAVLFISINKLSGQVYFWSFVTGLTYLVSVVTFRLSNSLKKFQYTSFAYLFVAVFCMAWNGESAIHFFQQRAKIQNQFRFADKFLVERDYFGEYLLHEAAHNISNDAFIQKRMATPFLGKDIIKQKINKVLLSGYFNKYNVDVYLYNALGESLAEGDTSSFSKSINAYSRDAFRTDYENVYWVTNAEGDFSWKYVTLIQIQKGQSTVGYVMVELSLKRIIPENVYPELLVDNRFQQGYDTRELSYAIIANLQVQYSSGDFNYDLFVKENLGEVGLFTAGIVRQNHLHVAVEDDNGRAAIVSSPIVAGIFQIADFSFLMVLGMAFILLLTLIYGLQSYSKSGNLLLAVRIQLIFNLAYFLPLIAVSVITLTLTTRSSQDHINQEYISKASAFGESVAIALKDFKEVGDFENQFTNLTVLANLDANVFSTEGYLMTSSQPLIFENHLLAPYINPLAIKRINRGDKVFVSTEQVGSLEFNVAYAALFSPDTGKKLGVLAIPFFQSASSIDHMRESVFANILSIFTLVFIVLLSISFLVTRWLTAPLQMIARTIGRISLTRTNTPLHWKAEDEIGLMVKEYNQMLIKLNDSKNEIERNQRERAWREIAQQVAHEIKNPLTPMKLTLQQLERSIQIDDQKSEKLKRAIGTLLSQVNSLEDIASSFSSFAKMPEPVISQVELVSLLTRIINLHLQEGSVEFNSTLTSALIMADEQLLGRIFSNVILNGLQATRDGVEPEVHIQLGKQKSHYRITFTDNGAGIDSASIDKIFLPHFTTKGSGSGLGLAIAKQGIEQLGGRISFETSPQGTTFSIELRQE